jgi:membrane fusion protein (multidrug efflux system)
MARTQRDIKKADMETAWAAVLSNERNLSKHKIYAPFGGIAGLKEISKGQFVSPGVELVKVVDCTPLKVDFKVAEADIDKIYVSQEAQILVGGDATKSYTAKIIAVDPESDTVTHTFDVRAVLNVPEGISEVDSQAIKPGRFVSVKIAANGEQQGILIPESCLEKIGDEDVVYRIVDGIAIRTLVTVGTRRDGNVEIITGINEGDLVVTSGQAGVLDGKGVSIKDESSTSDVVKAVKEIYEQQKNAKAKTAPAKANTSKK